LALASRSRKRGESEFDCIFVPLYVDGRNLHLSLEQARGTRWIAT